MTSAPATTTLDPALPLLAAALDPAQATAAMASSKHFRRAVVQVETVQLRRLKPGKRAVLDYTLTITWPDGRTETLAAIGKMRAGRPPRTAYQRAKAVWTSGFDASSADGVSVPEPLGTVPALGLWLQRRVEGRLATDLLTTSDGVAVAARVADAAVKLHRAGVPTERTHTPADELAILLRVLGDVATRRPELAARVHRLIDACARLAGTLDGPTTGIHRDFYADQVIVDGPRLYVIDFDLYCEGHAALDLGNFAGHLAEHAVRFPAVRPPLAAAEAALEARYVQHAGEPARQPLRIYTALTLARHVYLSTVVAGRAETTAAVLAEAEARTETLLDDVH